MENLDHIPMRREKVFNRDGGYSFVVENNLIFHRQATQLAIQLLEKRVTPKNGSIKILDLACGGAPTIPAAIMKHFHSIHFSYTGLDLNPDQVSRAKDHCFTTNVQANFLEGNAWTFRQIIGNEKFDVIFVGLNTHHASPKELSYFSSEVFKSLLSGGIFLNHDSFRPPQTPYLPRPKNNTSLNLVPTETLRPFEKAQPYTPPHPPKLDWRDKFVELFSQALYAHGAPSSLVQDMVQHVYERDFSISLEEAKTILIEQGLRVRTFKYDENKRLAPYYGFICGERI